MTYYHKCCIFEYGYVLLAKIGSRPQNCLFQKYTNIQVEKVEDPDSGFGAGKAVNVYYLH